MVGNFVCLIYVKYNYCEVMMMFFIKGLCYIVVGFCLWLLFGECDGGSFN